jgi:hypothetical protein
MEREITASKRDSWRSLSPRERARVRGYRLASLSPRERARVRVR